MATAITIINRALRLCKVLDAVEAAEAEDADNALETLNALLAEWHEADIGVPDYSFATLQTAVASDVADREAMAYQLAERIAPEYDVELSPLTMKASAEAMNRLRLRYLQPGTVSSAELPGSGGYYNITTDA
jgi:hypothetical protein